MTERSQVKLWWRKAFGIRGFEMAIVMALVHLLWLCLGADVEWLQDEMIVTLPGLVILGSFLAWEVNAYVLSPSKPETRTTKCYFVRQNRYESEAHLFNLWDPWFVWESSKKGGHNSFATKEEFKTKAAAWDFIQKWNLEACR